MALEITGIDQLQLILGTDIVLGTTLAGTDPFMTIRGGGGSHTIDQKHSSTGVFKQGYVFIFKCIP